MLILSVILMLIIGAFGIVSNGLTILVFWQNPLKVFHRLSIYSIKSLAIADFGTSIAAVLWGIEYQFPSHDFKLFCSWTFWATIQASLYTLVVISVERYIAVAYPHKRRTLLTQRKVRRNSAIIWLISILLASLILTLFKLVSGHKILQFLIYLCLFLVIVAFSSVYVVLFKKARQEFRQLEEKLPLDPSSPSDQKTGSEKQQRLNNADCRRLNFEREHKLFSLVSRLIIVLWATVVPYLISALVFVGKAVFCQGCSTESEELVNMIMFPLELLNFALNPVLYAFGLPYYRKSLKIVLCCRKGSRRRSTTADAKATDARSSLMRSRSFMESKSSKPKADS